MRFIDTNVFLYAILKPRRRLTEKELEIKEKARKIVSRVNNGERVLTTVVHISEIANILEDIIGVLNAAIFLRDIFAKKNILIVSVDPKDYLESIFLALEKDVSVNDALAYVIMKKAGIKEIYTFDKHFEKLNVVIVNE